MKTTTLTLTVTLIVEFDDTEMNESEMIEGLKEGIKTSFVDDIHVTSVEATTILTN